MSIDVAKHLAAFAKENISLAEWYILVSIGYFPMWEEELIRDTVTCSEGDPRGEIDTKACKEAFDHLLSLKYIQEVDELALEEMKEKVAKGKYGKPVYDYPDVEEIDFTEKGAKLYKKIATHLHGKYLNSFAGTHEVEDEVYYAHLLVDKDRITKEHQDLGHQTSVEEVGKWCIYWWQGYNSGWRITVYSDSVY